MDVRQERLTVDVVQSVAALVAAMQKSSPKSTAKQNRPENLRTPDRPPLKKAGKLPTTKLALDSPFPVPWQKPSPSDSEAFVEGLRNEIATNGKEEILVGVNQVMRQLERGLLNLVFVSGELQLGIVLQAMATLCFKTDAAFVALLATSGEIGKIMKMKTAIAVGFPKTSVKHQAFITSCRARAPKLIIPWLSAPGTFLPTKMSQQQPKRPAAVAAAAAAPPKKKKGQQQQAQKKKEKGTEPVPVPAPAASSASSDNNQEGSSK